MQGEKKALVVSFFICEGLGGTCHIDGIRGNRNISDKNSQVQER